tara:strand:+ start:257 stop:1270 length:1014 start_codon:yes stop_codon:yes gene_type:complete
MIIPHSKPWICKEEVESISSLLKSGQLTTGEKVKVFETKVRNFLGAKYSKSSISGTVAMIMALKILEVKKNDEVILPSYVCENVLFSVLSIEAKPVICDVNLDGVITSENIEKHITKNTKAIIAVHTFGHICNIEKLKIFDIPVISDLCQSFNKNNLPISNMGFFGDVGVLSFHATKCLTTGEGGMVITNDERYGFNLLKINKLNLYGSITDIQACLGITQLQRYNEFLKKREQLKSFYDLEFINIKNIPRNITYNVLFRYTFLSKKGFSNLEKQFLSKKICIRRGVDNLIHRKLNLNDKFYPNSVFLFERTISLPFYPSLNQKEIKRICKAMKDLF